MKKKHWLLRVFLALLALLILLPLALTLVYSFCSPAEMKAFMKTRNQYGGVLMELKLRPNSFSLDQYWRVLIQDTAILRYYFNSIGYTAANLAGQAVVIPMLAYALSRFEFRGRDIIAFSIIVLLLLPFQVTMVPTVLTLYAVDEMYPAICHEALKQGRYISAGDVTKQRRAMVVDEKAAFALFNGGEAMGKTLPMAGVDWEIVGIVADKFRFGEADESVAYVPISAALALDMDTLEMRVTGTSQAALVASALDDGSGSFYDLSREKYAALMPIRWVAIAAVILLAMWLIKQTVSMGKRDLADYRQRLTRHYPRELTEWCMGRLAVLLLLCAAAGLAAFAAMKLLTAPALVFTDWIPENPVSLSDYIERFWAIHRENARAIHYTTREVSMVALSAWLIRWGIFAVLGGTTITTTRRKPK